MRSWSHNQVVRHASSREKEYEISNKFITMTYVLRLRFQVFSKVTKYASSSSNFKYRWFNTFAISCIAIVHVMRSNHQNHLQDTERAHFAQFTLVCRSARLDHKRGRQGHDRLIIDQRLEYFRRERNSQKFPTLGILSFSYHLAWGILVKIYIFGLRHLCSISPACSPNSKLSFNWFLFCVWFVQINRFGPVSHSILMLATSFFFIFYKCLYFYFVKKCIVY